ncbi:hypothetical protein AB0N05_33530 [Nocardia sp. NPDC051030]|uniref:hypothetical protein n=1 Tax=Nocardia sp. NPDC051030 TaxID=3155162 RepID=UPI0034356EB8
MERLRELRFAPLWVVLPAVWAGLWGYMAVTGFSWFEVFFAACCTPVFVIAVVQERRRYGGRERMREFYDALHARQLPALTTAEEAIRWNRSIIDERTRRRSGLALSWFTLAVGSYCVLVSALLALKSPYVGGLDMPIVGAIIIATVAWTRFANPRVLAALDALAQQGTEHGYGHWLTSVK